jgi:hypothetical protein
VGEVQVEVRLVEVLLEVSLSHLVGCPRKKKKSVNIQSSTERNRVLEWDVPANCSARHSGNNPRAHATQEARPAKLALDDGSGVEQTPCGPHLLALCQATGLKERLYDVKGSGNTSCEGTGQTTCDAVGERVVLILGVHDLRDGLVGNELSGREGHGHAKCGGVGDVEGLDTFSAVEGLGALRQGLVN